MSTVVRNEILQWLILCQTRSKIHLFGGCILVPERKGQPVDVMESYIKDGSENFHPVLSVESLLYFFVSISYLD